MATQDAFEARAATEHDGGHKAAERALWALGDYHAFAKHTVWGLGPKLVEACGIGPGQRVLDVAAGTGNVAIRAAEAGAHVVASDLTPENFEAGRREARERGVELEWVEADAQALPFGDGEFDVVTSSLGAIFAPDHRAVADELLRVCRPGGTIGLLSWTPEGFVGRLFATMKPFAPAPPPGASPAPLWGSEDHLRTLFGDGVRELRAQRRTTSFAVSDSPEAFREWWKQNYGPTIGVYRGLDADRAAELDAAFLRMLEETRSDGAWEAEFLLVTAIRA